MARRWLALIDEPLFERAGQPRSRCVGEIAVISAAFAGQENVSRMMEVVIPLRVKAAAKKPDIIVVVLQDQMNVARRRGANFVGQFAKPSVTRDGVNGIEAQSVEAEFM